MVIDAEGMQDIEQRGEEGEELEGKGTPGSVQCRQLLHPLGMLSPQALLGLHFPAVLFLDFLQLQPGPSSLVSKVLSSLCDLGPRSC